MCGIFAYQGTKKSAGDIILSGLKTLEYRGYDSWGVALKLETDSVYVSKHIGKIGNAALPTLRSHIGLGHTRWATHGGVTEKNAHPHTDAKKKVIVVHNGIVENFAQLKAHLIAHGYQFLSETDSEVIPHRIAEYIAQGKSPQVAFHTTVKELKGLNAVIALFPDTEELFVFKNGSPLVLGSTKHEVFVASDASALVPYTKKVYFLEDGEIVHIHDGAYQLQDKHGKIKTPRFTILQYGAQDIVRGTYPHFMLKEIHEQPQVIQNILDTQGATIADLAKTIKSAYGTYLIGCGTASYAGLAGTYLFSKIAKRHINTCIASEFTYQEDFLKDTSLVIALSQSGETIDIISSIQKAKEQKAKIMAVTNVLGSSVYRMADYRFLLQAGPEIGVASTKAYTAKLAWLYLTAHTLAHSQKQGHIQLQNAITEVKAVLRRKKMIQNLALHLMNKPHMFVLGRGVSYAAALEAALKIKEVSYTHAEAFAGGELKHGPIALIDTGTPVLIFNPDDETYQDALSSAYEVKARGAYVIGISSKPHPIYDAFIEIKNCKDATIIPSIVVAQLIGYYLAVTRNLDPDKPRNLAKSVTVK